MISSTALVEIKHTELNEQKNLGQNQYSSAKGLEENCSTIYQQYKCRYFPSRGLGTLHTRPVSQRRVRSTKNSAFQPDLPTESLL